MSVAAISHLSQMACWKVRDSTRRTLQGVEVRSYNEEGIGESKEASKHPRQSHVYM